MRSTFVLAGALALLGTALPGVAAEMVKVNCADAATLAAALDGVGDAKAAEIVAHRETQGAFASPDDLGNVKGIGEKTVAANRDRIDVAQDCGG